MSLCQTLSATLSLAKPLEVNSCFSGQNWYVSNYIIYATAVCFISLFDLYTADIHCWWFSITIQFPHLWLMRTQVHIVQSLTLKSSSSPFLLCLVAYLPKGFLLSSVVVCCFLCWQTILPRCFLPVFASVFHLQARFHSPPPFSWS